MDNGYNENRQQLPGMRLMANAGLLLDTARGQIGIDLFAKDPQGIYEDLSIDEMEQVLSDVREGTLHTFLFTHSHPDHFNGAMMRRAADEALMAGREITVISTPDVIARIKGEYEAGVSEVFRDVGVWKKNGLRLIAADKSQWQEYRIGSAGVFVRFALHDGKEFEETQHLIIRVENEGTRTVFLGDAKPRLQLFEELKEKTGEIDWLLAPFPYYAKSSVRAMMARYLNISHAVLYHFPLEEKDRFGWRERTVRAVRSMKEPLPVPYISFAKADLNP